MREVGESDRLGEAPHPRDTDDLRGHHAAEAALLDAFRSGRLHHAWLIGGPRGIGKATLAWRFARFLLAHPDPSGAAARAATSLHVPPNHPASLRLRAGGSGDVAVLRREWNDKSRKPFSEIRVDDVRAAMRLFQRSAAAGGWRICILDCAEDLNRSSANALLKSIEEPPPRALFLIVSHQPSQVMPTILSRCRKLFLSPLPEEDVAAVVRSISSDDDAREDADVAGAVRRSGGSVGRALSLLEEPRRSLDRELAAELGRLPNLDARALHRLADRFGVADSADLAMLVETVLDWIDARLREGAGQGAPAHRLAPFAEVWERIFAASREADALNLDKRPLILSMFADLAEASRMAGRT